MIGMEALSCLINRAVEGNFLSGSTVELASRAGGSGWAGPTSGQRNNRADRAGPDLNQAAILLTQPGPISG